jgi:hypothetical protein
MSSGQLPIDYDPVAVRAARDDGMPRAAGVIEKPRPGGCNSHELSISLNFAMWRRASSFVAATLASLSGWYAGAEHQPQNRQEAAPTFSHRSHSGHCFGAIGRLWWWDFTDVLQQFFRVEQRSQAPTRRAASC